MKCLPLWAILLAVLPVSAAPKTPGFVRFSLGDWSLSQEKSAMIYDPQTRYFLYATGDCDGAVVSLHLTPSLEALGLGSVGDLNSVNRAPIPRLRNGKGVNIGDSTATVARKIGLPTKAYWHEQNWRVWFYSANLGRSARGPRSYEAQYHFRNGKLWAISYALVHEHSCG